MKAAVAFRGRLRRIGKAPLCNGCADRAPRLGSFVFVLCYRCTGLVVGYAGGLLALTVAPETLRLDPAVLAMALIALPLDALAQRYTKYHSTNVRRLLTGLAFGMVLSIT